MLISDNSYKRKNKLNGHSSSKQGELAPKAFYKAALLNNNKISSIGHIKLSNRLFNNLFP